MHADKSAEVGAWMAKAASDLGAAQQLAGGPDPKRDVAVYHCQQAAEKALKAWLVLRDIHFEKTHDLERLIGLDAETAELLELSEHARLLTPYATEFRYPGDVFEPDEEESAEAVRLAGKTYECIASLMLCERRRR